MNTITGRQAASRGWERVRSTILQSRSNAPTAICRCLPRSDFGNVNGFVHSHNFAAANTAVPFSYGDTKQLQAAENFLKNAVTVDIFAISPARPQAAGGSGSQSDMSTTLRWAKSRIPDRRQPMWPQAR